MKEFKLAAIFTNHCVLQREKPITIWGVSKKKQEDNQVIVTFLGESYKGSCKEGKWQVNLPAQKAGGPYELKVTCEESEITLLDIYIGEVWLAGGQSNMEFPLNLEDHGKEEMLDMNQPLLRFYQVYQTPDISDKEYESTWLTARKDSFANVSAAAYYYGKELQKKLGVAVGIIGCYMGGTSISCWMSKESLEELEEGREYLSDYKKRVGNKTREEFNKEQEQFLKEVNDWNQRADDIKRKQPGISGTKINELIGSCPWFPPAGEGSPYRPAGLYESMLMRVCPYGIRGFLFYQGEEDEKCPQRYEKMLTHLIALWRAKWKEELPFVIVQLPMFIEKGAEDTGTWVTIRKAQYQVYKNTPQTGFVVLIDQGEYDNVHPTNKLIVGKRLVLQVLETFYHEQVEGTSPYGKKASVENGQIRIEFTKPVSIPDEKVPLLVVKGEMGEASNECELKSKGNELVITTTIKNPIQVEYAQVNYGYANLFGVNGLAVAPFLFQLR